MKLKADDFQLFGVWDGILIFDHFTWYNPKVNELFSELSGVKRESLCLLKENTQYLFFSKKTVKQLENHWNNTDLNVECKKVESFLGKEAGLKERLGKISSQEAGNRSNQELCDLIDRCFLTCSEATVYDQYCMMSEGFVLPKLDSYLKKELEKQGRQNEYESVLATVTMPSFLSTTSSEELEVATLALKCKKANIEPNETELNQLTEKYGHVPCLLFSQAWNKEHYIQRIEEEKKQTKQVLEEKKRKIESFSLEQEKRIQAATKGFEKSGLPRLMQLLTFVRNESELMASLCHKVINPLLAESAKRLKISFYQARRLSPSELREFLVQEGNALELAESRKEIVGQYTNGDFVGIIEKSGLAEFARPLPVEKLGKENRRCASAGKAIGKVRQVRPKEDIFSFRKGEVLVAFGTCIDFLPAMRLARAIITENGGITSHAAIISRELEIPCIVGVKDALSQYKNGALVEIDAGNKEITILKINPGE